MGAVFRFHSSVRRGGLLVEVVIGLALGILFGVAIVTMGIGTFDSIHQSRDRFVAINYAVEGLEAVRSIARYKFDNLSVGSHGLDHNGVNYVLSGSTNAFNKFARTIQIDATYRDDGNALIIDPDDPTEITDADGWKDTQVYQVTSTVTWEDKGLTQSVSLESVFSKWYVFPLERETATGSLVSGTEYEFNPIDGGVLPSWKAIYWNLDGGIDYTQVRVGDTYSELTTNEWIGPTGGTGSFYNIWGSGLATFSAGSGRWFQAKAWLTGTGTAAPIITILRQ